ncbi:MAG TPA: hypothetical protein VGQ46_18965 [Thermoanaerobaculia bacterium]|jgi:hypothetical protein|nr:hypothetical protein [Thermoanaerobaculia bacterium]
MPQAAESLRAETLPLTSFVDDGRTLSLSKPLVLQVSVEDGACFVDYEPLHLFAKGSSLEEAVEAFAADLAYYWRYYNSLRDDEVAGAGLELKRIYEGLVRPE